jgi:uncharacterized protein
MKHRSVLLLVFSLLLSLWGVQAQLLWKVTGNGISKPGYLFGTHHLISKDQIPDFDRIMLLCEQTEAVVGEIDMDEPGSKLKTMQGSMMKEMKIKDLVSDTDYQMLDAEFKSLAGVGMNMLGSMKPMALVSLFQVMSYLKSEGIEEQPEPVDALFQDCARRLKKKVLGLETMDQQLDILLNSIPIARQAEILLRTVKEKDRDLTDTKALQQAYITGDLSKMLELFSIDESMNVEELNIFADKRNLQWIKKLPSMFREQSCFVAVGCLHLVGDTGMIQQLRLAGFTVEPVLFNE